jgi:hypothetical protein
MAEIRFNQLTDGTPVSTDIIPFENDPSGSQLTKKTTVANLASSLGIVDASTSAKGIIEIATDAETLTGSDTARAITPANLLSRIPVSTAVSDFLVGQVSGVWLKKTLAEVLTILGKAAASGLASLDGSSKVVQDPANATSTATASKIPIADGSGKLDTWVSDSSTTVKGKVELATSAETITGSDSARAVTPAGLHAKTASDTALGIVELATSAETITGTDTGRVVTPAGLQAKVASDTALGIVELATSAEINTGTDAGRAISPDALAGSLIFGVKGFEVQIVEPATDVDTTSGVYFARIPQAMNGMNLIRAQAFTNTAGTTNATTVQVRNMTKYASNDALSTAISIASGNTVGTAGTVNTSYDDVATDDLIKIYVTAQSTTKPKGLLAVLEYQLP